MPAYKHAQQNAVVVDCQLLFERPAANRLIAGKNHPHAQPMACQAMDMMVGEESRVVVFRIDCAVFQLEGSILDLRYLWRSMIRSLALVVDDMVREKAWTGYATQN